MTGDHWKIVSYRDDQGTQNSEEEGAPGMCFEEAGDAGGFPEEVTSKFRPTVTRKGRISQVEGPCVKVCRWKQGWDSLCPGQQFGEEIWDK